MVLGDRAEDEAQGIDSLQNMEIVMVHKAEDHFIKEGQSVLEGIYGKVGISVSDCTEIVCGKLSGGVVDRSAVGDGTVFGEIDPQEGDAEYPETGEPEQNEGAYFQAGEKDSESIEETEKTAQKQKVEERIIKVQADHICVGLFN